MSYILTECIYTYTSYTYYTMYNCIYCALTLTIKILFNVSHFDIYLSNFVLQFSCHVSHTKTYCIMIFILF